MYIATAYIGTDYTPGEILPDDLDRALLERLIRAGAAQVTAPDPVFIPAKAAEPEAAPAPIPEEEPEEEEEAEEAYEEPEAPEVDMTDALVKEPAAKPAKSTRKGAKGK